MKPSFPHIPTIEFKAKCLQLIDQVNQTHMPIIITKHGTPIAKLIPIEENSVRLFELQENTIVIKGDIIAPVDEDWDANS